MVKYSNDTVFKGLSPFILMNWGVLDEVDCRKTRFIILISRNPENVKLEKNVTFDGPYRVSLNTWRLGKRLKRVVAITTCSFK